MSARAKGAAKMNPRASAATTLVTRLSAKMVRERIDHVLERLGRGQEGRDIAKHDSRLGEIGDGTDKTLELERLTHGVDFPVAVCPDAVPSRRFARSTRGAGLRIIGVEIDDSLTDSRGFVRLAFLCQALGPIEGGRNEAEVGRLINVLSMEFVEGVLHNFELGFKLRVVGQNQRQIGERVFGANQVADFLLVFRPTQHALDFGVGRQPLSAATQRSSCPNRL